MNKILIFVSSIFVFFSAYSVQAVDITIARFFGDCDDAGSDTTTTTGEACIIQSIINAFNDANPDINVTTEVLDWGMTYEILQTRYGDKNPPDLHIMHRHRIPQFASIGAIADLKGEIAGPVLRQKVYTSSINFCFPNRTPPITRPCPSKYLVAE